MDSRGSTPRKDKLHLKIDGLAEGEVSLSNCPTGVALVGSHLEGTVKIKKIDSSVKRILVTISETTHVVVDGKVHEALPDYQMVPAAISGSQKQKGVEEVFTSCFVIEFDENSSKDINEASQKWVQFDVAIPSTALPTLSRGTEGHLVGHHTKLKISAEVSCVLEVVAIVGDLLDRKVLESTSITLIGNGLPQHLRGVLRNAKRSSTAISWEPEVSHVDGSLSVVFLADRMVIGKKLDFEIRYKGKHKASKVVKWAKLDERLLCTDDNFTIKTLDEFVLPQFGSKYTSDHPGWTLATAHPRQQAPFSKLHPVHAWRIDHETPDDIKLHFDDTETDLVKFSVTIPSTCKYQNTFSSPHLFNVWILAIKLEEEEVHVGPLPIVWPADVNTESLEKLHRASSLHNMSRYKIEKHPQ